ncbi:MAG: hypothetical protein ACREUQ_07410 [Burkholderiales bacterium]
MFEENYPSDPDAAIAQPSSMGWNPFDEFSGWVDAIASGAQAAEGASADIRRATVYTQQEINKAVANAKKAKPTDPSLNYVQRLWFYASDQEKFFIIVAAVGAAFALAPYIKKAI